MVGTVIAESVFAGAWAGVWGGAELAWVSEVLGEDVYSFVLRFFIAAFYYCLFNIATG